MLSRLPVSGAIAFTPLLLFLALFLGTGLYYQAQGVEYAFYQLPAPVAILPPIVLAFLLAREKFDAVLSQFLQGMGNSNVLTMCLIYLLAGAFSAVSKSTGAAEAAVSLSLTAVPSDYLLPGLFVVSALLATAMGTSMGTLAALVPIGSQLAASSGIDPLVIAGVLIGGAMFGDNLSLISDTTIAATKTQGAAMADKFKANLRIALPSAALVLLLLIFAAESAVTPSSLSPTSPWLALPYVLVFALAVAGINVFLVLPLGILSTALLSSTVGYELAQLPQDVYQGFGQMQEIMLLSLLMAGLSALLTHQGGLDFLMMKFNRLFQMVGKLGHAAGLAVIGALAGLVNLAVANNTVAILTVADAAKDVANGQGISPKQSASALDISACVVQGLVPYGAQALLVAAALNLSPLQVVVANVYCQILGGLGLLVLAGHWLTSRTTTSAEPLHEVVS